MVKYGNNVAIKLVLTLVLLTALIIKINIFDIFHALKTVNFVYFLLFILFTPILCIIRAYRWSILLNSINIDIPFITLLSVLVIGIFYGLITPGKIGEIGRACHLKQEKAQIIPTILMEKIIDIFVLIMLSTFTIILFFNDIKLKYTLVICTFVFIFFIWLSKNVRFISLLSKPLKVTEEQVSIYLNSFSILSRNRKIVFTVTVLAILYYIVVYVLSFFVLTSMDVDPILMITFPIIILMGNIPVTISGLGLRESVGVICFLLLGESAINGFIFSILLFTIITLLPGIFGYILIIRRRDGDHATEHMT